MFTIDIYLKETEDRGLGVFCKEPIKKGQIIWEFIEGLDIVIHQDKLKKLNLNQIQKDFISKYFWKEGENYYSSCDHSIFQNHGTNPNSTPEGDYMVASRDIEAHEEIVVQYSDFDDDFYTYKHQLH